MFVAEHDVSIRLNRSVCLHWILYSLEAAVDLIPLPLAKEEAGRIGGDNDLPLRHRTKGRTHVSWNRYQMFVHLALQFFLLSTV